MPRAKCPRCAQIITFNALSMDQVLVCAGCAAKIRVAGSSAPKAPPPIPKPVPPPLPPVLKPAPLPAELPDDLEIVEDEPVEELAELSEPEAYGIQGQPKPPRVTPAVPVVATAPYEPPLKRTKPKKKKPKSFYPDNNDN